MIGSLQFTPLFVQYLYFTCLKSKFQLALSAGRFMFRTVYVNIRLALLYTMFNTMFKYLSLLICLYSQHPMEAERSSITWERYLNLLQIKWRVNESRHGLQLPCTSAVCSNSSRGHRRLLPSVRQCYLDTPNQKMGLSFY